MSHRAYTPEAEVEIAEKYRAGASLRALVREYGGTTFSLRNCIRRNGVPPHAPGRAPWRDVSAEQAAEMARRWQDGQSQSRIAHDMGFDSQTTVSRILREHGFEKERRLNNPRGPNSPSWRGGEVNLGGYRAVKVAPNHPYASMRGSSGYVLKHRLVMAESLGRRLTKGETVHHINGDKADNRLENLQLRQGNHGKGVVMACLDCGSHRFGPVPITAA